MIISFKYESPKTFYKIPQKSGFAQTVVCVAAVSFFPGGEGEQVGKRRGGPAVSKKLRRSTSEREGREVGEKRNRLQSVPNILLNSALSRTGSNDAI